MGFKIGNVLAAVNPTAVLGSMFSDGVSSVWSTNRTNHANKEMAAQQNLANERAAKIAYEREVELMNMQNAYNTPAAQMARYKEAGLNPNLIYGQSNMSASPTVQKVADVVGYRKEGYKLPSILAAYVQLASLENAAKELDLKSGQLDLALSNAADLMDYREKMLGATNDRLSFEKQKWNAELATRQARKILLDKKIQALGQSISLLDNPLYRSGAPWWMQVSSRLPGISANDEAYIDNYLGVAAGVR